MPVSNPNDLAIPESDVADQNNPGFWSQGMDPNGSDNTGAEDNSTAFDVMNQVMQYGRKKHGLLPDSPSQTNDNDEDDQPQTQQEASTPSYAEGGEVDGDEQGAIPEAEDNQDTQQEAQPQAQQGAGGMDKAWALAQAFRNKYNAYKSFAAAALNGAPGKAPDIMAAARAATQASPYALTGDTVNFTPGQNGVTAAVTKFGQRQPSQQIPLSIPAFKQWLQGPAGSFDIMQKHGTSVLSQLAGGGQQQQAQSPHFARGGSADDNDQGPYAGIPDQRAATPSNGSNGSFEGSASSDDLGRSASDGEGGVQGFTFGSRPDYSTGSGAPGGLRFDDGGDVPDDTLTPLPSDNSDDNTRNADVLGSKVINDKADSIFSGLGNTLKNAYDYLTGPSESAAAPAAAEQPDRGVLPSPSDEDKITSRPTDDATRDADVAGTKSINGAVDEAVSPIKKKIADYVRGAGQRPLAGSDKMSAIVSYLKGSNAAPAEAADAAMAAASQSANHPGEAAVKAVVDAAQGKSALATTGRTPPQQDVQRLVNDYNMARNFQAPPQQAQSSRPQPQRPQDPFVKMGYDPQLVQKARFMFPGRPQLMQKYLDEQTQQGETNEINRTKAENPLGIAKMKDDTARYTADQRHDSAAARVNAALKINEDKFNNNLAVTIQKTQGAAKIALMKFQTELMSDKGNPMGRDLDKVRQAGEFYGIPPNFVNQLVNASLDQAPQAPQSPQARAPQAPQPGQQQSAETRVINGRTYVKVPGGWKAQ